MQDELTRKIIIAKKNEVWDKATRTKECLHPNAPTGCSSKFGKAHSVQRRKLEKIAENGHVLQFNNDRMSGETSVRRVGIKQASTFYGFCKHHDDKLFAPIEKKPLNLNEHHALLLAYRSISIHIYYKRRRAATNLFCTVPKHLIVSPTLIKSEKSIRNGVDELLRMAEPIYKRMGKAILNRNYSDTNYFAIELDTVPDILCSDASIINFGFRGTLVRERPKPLDLITCSLLPYEERRGVIVFAWYGKNTANENFISSLRRLREHEVPDAIVRFLFRSTGNFFIAPKWWNQLSEDKQHSLSKKEADRSLIADFTADGYSYVDWEVINFETNLKL